MTFDEFLAVWGEGAAMTVCYDLSSDDGLDLLVADAKKRAANNKAIRVCFVNEQSEPEVEEKPQRTYTQNRAMHLYFTQLSDALNDAGFDIKKTMKAGVDIPWTPSSVKERLWKVIENVMFQHESTTQLTTDQCSQVYEVVNRKIATTTGVSVPWPSRETMMRESQ